MLIRNAAYNEMLGRREGGICIGVVIEEEEEEEGRLAHLRQVLPSSCTYSQTRKVGMGGQMVYFFLHCFCLNRMSFNLVLINRVELYYLLVYCTYVGSTEMGEESEVCSGMLYLLLRTRQDYKAFSISAEWGKQEGGNA